MDGMMTLSQASGSLDVKPRATKKLSQPSVTRTLRDPVGDEASLTTITTPQRELVDMPDGLASVFKEYAAICSMSQRKAAPSPHQPALQRPSASFPRRNLRFNWEAKDESEEELDSPDGDFQRGPPSINRDNISQSSQRESDRLDAALPLITDLQERMLHLEEENAEREEALTAVIKTLRKDIQRLERGRANDCLYGELRGYTLPAQPYIILPAKKGNSGHRNSQSVVNAIICHACGVVKLRLCFMQLCAQRFSCDSHHPSTT